MKTPHLVKAWWSWTMIHSTHVSCSWCH